MNASIVNKLSSVKIAMMYDCSPDVVLKLLHANNIPLSELGFHQQKYTVDEDYFSKIDTANKAYVFGLIAADGSVQKYCLSLGLKEEDRCILEQIKIDMKSSHPISDCWIKGRNYPHLRIGRKKIASDLLSLGLKENKTYDISFPTKLSKHLYPHFIRGVVDGDGCVDAEGNSLMIAGHKNLLEPISEILFERCDLMTKPVFYPTKGQSVRMGGNGGIIQVGGRFQMSRIREFLYPPETSLAFERKKKRFFSSSILPLSAGQQKAHLVRRANFLLREKKD